MKRINQKVEILVIWTPSDPEKTFLRSSIILGHQAEINKSTLTIYGLLGGEIYKETCLNQRHAMHVFASWLKDQARLT